MLIDGRSHVRDGFKRTFILRDPPQGYENGVPILEAHIQEWEKYYRHMGGYSMMVAPCPLFTDRRPNELRYLHQPGAREAGFPFYK